uniref:SnoaL-like domain-containing protein n=1 Tax=Oryza brachyantha TaxID=4533 RepID=J3M637_ORYBR
MELGEAAERNERLVESLYAAVAAGDGAAAEAVLADDVEWWFHGPRRCEHMRRRLAGEDQAAAFVFVPRREQNLRGKVNYVRVWLTTTQREGIAILKVMVTNRSLKM